MTDTIKDVINALFDGLMITGGVFMLWAWILGLWALSSLA